jgi:hypothetical protein
MASKTKWKNSEGAQSELKALIVMKSRCLRFESLLPSALFSTFDKLIEDLSSTTGLDIGIIEPIEVSSQTQQCLLSNTSTHNERNTLPILKSIDYLAGILNRVTDDRTVSDDDLRYYQTELKLRYKATPDVSPVKPLIKRVVTAINYRRSSAAALPLSNTLRTDSPSLYFDTESNGLCFGGEMLQALDRRSQPDTLLRKDCPKILRKALPLFSRVLSGEQHNSYQYWRVSRGQELYLYKKGQLTFGNSSDIQSLSFSKRYIKLCKPAQVFVWGSSEYSGAIQEYCQKLGIYCHSISVSELAKIKDKLEIQISAEEIRNTAQLDIIREPAVDKPSLASELYTMKSGLPNQTAA